MTGAGSEVCLVTGLLSSPYCMYYRQLFRFHFISSFHLLYLLHIYSSCRVETSLSLSTRRLRVSLLYTYLMYHTYSFHHCRYLLSTKGLFVILYSLSTRRLRILTIYERLWAPVGAKVNQSPTKKQTHTRVTPLHISQTNLVNLKNVWNTFTYDSIRRTEVQRRKLTPMEH